MCLFHGRSRAWAVDVLETFGEVSTRGVSTVNTSASRVVLSASRLSALGSGSFSLGVTVVVPYASGTSGRSSHFFGSRKSRSLATMGAGSSRHPRNALASRVVAVRRHLSAKGVFGNAISLISDFHRHSTKSVYVNHGGRWCAWCRVQRVHPLDPPVVDLVNQFPELASTWHLSISILRFRTSDICRTYAGSLFCSKALLRGGLGSSPRVGLGPECGPILRAKFSV